MITEGCDLGKIVLQRARSEDRTSICKLLSKKINDGVGIGVGIGVGSSERRRLYNSVSCVSPLSLIGVSPPLTPSEDDTTITPNPSNENIDLTNLASLLWNGLTLTLVLSRAVASAHETPLGCAILLLGFSLEKGRLLRVVEIAHEEHLIPRERFVECLEALSVRMGYCLEVGIYSLSSTTAAGVASNSSIVEKNTNTNNNGGGGNNNAVKHNGNITLSDRDMMNVVNMHSKHLNNNDRQELTDTATHALVSSDGIESLPDASTSTATAGIDRHGHGGASGGGKASLNCLQIGRAHV